MVLSVVDECGQLAAYCIDVVETRKGHVAIEVGGSGPRMNGEYLQRCVVLLELHRQYAHHGVLRSLAGYICQWMPIRTDL